MKVARGNSNLSFAHLQVVPHHEDLEDQNVRQICWKYDLNDIEKLGKLESAPVSPKNEKYILHGLEKDKYLTKSTKNNLDQFHMQKIYLRTIL
jgi:hypothetical protein